MLEILQAPLIIAGISAILAAVISIVDKLVNNYGTVKININDETKVLETDGGTPLLFTLSGEGIYVPSACGGKGTCGACKVKVKSDVGPHLPTETPLLTKEEIASNTRLACQVKVKSDISIDIPEELFNIKQFNTVVEKITDVTHDIKEVWLKLKEPADISFKAGQYAQLVIPPYDKVKEETQRAYSILSTPGEKNKLGFLIRLVPGGIATTYVHTKLQEKQPLEIVGPMGDFFLQETGADMICIAGGSGMAPICSIVYDMLENNKTERDVWYFFGAVSLKDLFYLEEFKELEKKWPRFHFVPALSEPAAGDNWTGETGLITEVVDKYLKEKINPDNPKEGYLCGSPGMINACIKVLTSNKIPEEKIYYDKFA